MLAVLLLMATGVWLSRVNVIAQDCYKASESHLYKGTVSVTRLGYTCERWDNPNPTHKRARNLRFPDRTLSDAGNFCRDPDYLGQPWCYTTNRAKRWDKCNVPICTRTQEIKELEAPYNVIEPGSDIVAEQRATHVVHIGVDGLLASCVRDAGAGNIMSRLGGQGTFTLTNARTEDITTSGPCWTAVLTGLPINLSGVTENKWQPGQTTKVNGITNPVISPFPTIFSTLKMQDRRTTTSAFYSWPWLKYLMTRNDPASVDSEYQSKPVRNDYASADLRTLDSALTQLRRVLAGRDRSYTFVYFGNVDVTGHEHGYDCNSVPQYRDAIRTVDNHVGRLLDVVDQISRDKTVVILNSDHGGLGRKHAMLNDKTVHVPIFIRGAGIKSGQEFKTKIRNLDIAPTVTAVLGLESSPFWKGKPLTEAFEN